MIGRSSLPPKIRCSKGQFIDAFQEFLNSDEQCPSLFKSVYLHLRTRDIPALSSAAVLIVGGVFMKLARFDELAGDRNGSDMKQPSNIVLWQLHHMYPHVRFTNQGRDG